MTTKPPANLRASGRKLWTAVTTAYDLEHHELTLLLQAARTADLLDDLEDEVRSAGAIVGSPQGPKANPAAVEARQHRIALARLLVALRILESPADKDRTQTRAVRGVYRMRGAS